MNWLDVFIYSNGVLYWKIQPSRRVKIGSKAGSFDSYGYFRIKYKGADKYAHRVIWEMHYGEIPDGYEIDHISHDKCDNRIENLRLVTQQENKMNKKKYKTNLSGATGVRWDKKLGKWHSQIKIGGVKKSLGFYMDISDAIDARKNAEVNLGFHVNHGK